MGGIYEYRCSRCNYERSFFGGMSGINARYKAQYYCIKRKEIIVVQGEATIDGVPSEKTECPDCKNHPVKMWDYETCPKCLKKNKINRTGHWD